MKSKKVAVKVKTKRTGFTALDDVRFKESHVINRKLN